MRRLLTTIAAIALVVSTAPTAEAATVVKRPVSFEVTNPLDPGSAYTVKGFLYQRSDQARCSSSVTLLVHGLSYGAFAWDFNIKGKTISVARELAAAGYPAVAIDLPGYGASGKPNGYTLTVQSYAEMVGEIVGDLREDFSHVGILGHSAGTEISELAVALGFAEADVLIATGYTHFPSVRIVQDFFTGDYLRAAQDDYEYFGGDVQGRTDYMYHLPNADPAVVKADMARAQLTPSGEVYSIGPQPSRLLTSRITIPTFLVLAEHDLLFPYDFADEELLLFSATPDVTLMKVPASGHSFMLHRNASATNASIVKWLRARMADYPSC